MLRRTGSSRSGVNPLDPLAVPSRPDPVVTVTTALLSLIGVGLLVAAVSAVYTYATPSWEGPLVLAIAAVFGLTLLVNIGAAATRHFRRPADA